MLQRNQFGDDLLVFLLVQFEPGFCSQKDSSLSLSIYITTCGGKPLHKMPQADFHTHTEVEFISALCCINYTCSVLNTDFFFLQETV